MKKQIALTMLEKAQARWPRLAVDLSCIEDALRRHYASESPAQIAAEDYVLACGVAAQVPVAWEIFYAEYGDFLRRVIRRHCQNDGDAEEIASDFCGEDAPRRLRLYAGRCSLRGWLAGVAPNVARDWHRRRRREILLPQAAEQDDSGDSPGMGLDERAAMTREETERGLNTAIDERECEKMLRDSFRSGWALLRPDMREILEYKYVHGLKSREIGAMILRVREDVVSKRLKKALAGFGRLLRLHALSKFNYTAEEVGYCVDLLLGRLDFQLLGAGERAASGNK